MKILLIIKYSVITIFLLIIFSCNEEETTAPNEENLLYETSFENNGMFSTNGWILSSESRVSNSTPSGGGNYSLEITATGPPEIYSTLKVPVKTKYSINKLTLWSKASGVTNNVFGKVVLALVRNGVELQSKNIIIDTIDWRTFSIQDTFNVAVGDSFMIKLSGGMNQLLSGKTYFDLLQLQGIN